MATRPRELPYVHVRTLSKLLAGEAHCEWSAWFRAQYYFDKRPGDGSYSGSDHQIKHTKMLKSEQSDLEGDGYTVAVEKQNDFIWKGKAAKLAGTPDIVATRDDESLIVDVKSGAACASHEIQVLIYMWVVPIWFKMYEGRKFRGLLVYENDHRFIEPSKLTSAFINEVSQTIRRLADSNPCRKVPSARECKYCPIGEKDCPERVTEDLVALDDARAPNDFF